MKILTHAIAAAALLAGLAIFGMLARRHPALPAT